MPTHLQSFCFKTKTPKSTICGKDRKSIELFEWSTKLRELEILTKIQVDSPRRFQNSNSVIAEWQN